MCRRRGSLGLSYPGAPRRAPLPYCLYRCRGDITAVSSASKSLVSHQTQEIPALLVVAGLRFFSPLTYGSHTCWKVVSGWGGVLLLLFVLLDLCTLEENRHPNEATFTVASGTP